MARADQITALLRAYAGDEDAQFTSIALQMAADEAQRGHVRLASEMRALIDAAKAKQFGSANARPVPLAQPKGELAELLVVVYPQQHLADMVARPEVMSKLVRILKEQREHVRLSGHGLTPRRKLLLVGPPGTGKTLTASVLATELKLPLFIVRFDSLLTKFMGESASKLRLVFDMIRTARGVYLFDEFDSLGLERGGQQDVAEMRRTLNMFLQLIEQDTSESLIVAATNHGDALDGALFRRFDDVVRYSTPDDAEIARLLFNNLAMFAPDSMDYAALVPIAHGLSHADIARACRDAMKDAVLERQGAVSEIHVLAHLQERSASLRDLKYS